MSKILVQHLFSGKGSTLARMLSFFSLSISSKSECAAAAAKSLQLCPILCDPIDGSPPGSPIPGLLQARTLKWVAISFSKSVCTSIEMGPCSILLFMFGGMYCNTLCVIFSTSDILVIPVGLVGSTV